MFVFCCHFYHKNNFVELSAFSYKENILYLVEPASSQIVSNDHIRHGVEDKLYVLSVGGAGHVTVDLLRGRLVLGLELSLDVGSSLSVLLGACILRETNSQG